MGANVAAVQAKYYGANGPIVSGGNGPIVTVSAGQSLAAAVAAAPAGSTIEVGPGVYAGGFAVTADNVTLISTVPGGARIVDQGQSAWDSSAVYLKGNGQSLVGFDVSGAGPSAWSAPLITTGSNNTFALNTVHDVLTTAAAMAADGGHGGAAIVAAADLGGTNVRIIGNTIANVVPSGQRSSLVHGIYPTMSGTVADNVISNVGGVGIHMYHSPSGITVTNNTVTGARDGGILFGSDSGTAGASTITVKDNVVTGSPTGVSTYGAVGDGNVVTNNVLVGNGAPTSLSGVTATGTLTSMP
jgi:parallel beta-helix repeat protein